ncbi:type VI secretion system membrane subunit TssM [Methylocapsa polymorpha]|uniref:Type VI secretion system membrane subunit TssM n=1 Tax=Methylocapsa polymorpha TaxID=3080828 RepID=A0ABZ0HV05_9HYPH|nr:type VI secretion system membrane subunit TssM [Methylocapsa sp. RX1]
MTRNLWLGVLFNLAGAAAVAGLIWFAGPFIRLGEAHPLEGQGPRLAAILALFILVAGSGAYRLNRRRKRAEQIARGMAGGDSDPAALAARMKEALAALRSARGGLAHYFYEALVRFDRAAGSRQDHGRRQFRSLTFPLAAAAARPIAGVGGARNCDWWFAEEAVLIDASGRYAAEAKTDQKSWFAFLDLLRRNRPSQPINGVLVAMSVKDLLTLSPAEVAAHAALIKSRLVELRQRLGVDFPVYVLFTKADLIGGFREYFASLDDAGRAQVWGATFKTRSPLAEVPAQFEALVERLNKGAPDRLAEEKDPAKRVRLFGFPAQMEALRGQVTLFLNEIFDPAHYQINAPLRGFYFSSGAQQGAPIDQLLGAFAKNFGVEPVEPPVLSGPAKSFFLTDLIKKVVVGEAGWVSTGRGGRVARLAGFVLLFVVAPLILGAWWMSYAKNSERIAQSEEAAAKYSALAAGLGQSDAVSDRDLSKVLPALHALRFLPGGFVADRAAANSASSRFGLNQAARLRSAAETAYGMGLERLLRPRLVFRLEEQVAASADNPTALLEALKVYLMLGGLQTADRQLLINWLARDWSENLYPGPKNAEGRKELEQHVLAMLDLEAARGPLVLLNGPLVEKAQAALARVKVAERAYQLLAAGAKATPHDDWIASKSGGAGARLVFDDSIAAIHAPYFLTRSGFEQAFMDRLPAVVEEMERDRWVLGAAGEQPAIAAQYDRLQQDLVDNYVKAFVDSWRGAIDKLKIRRLTAERGTYPLLTAAASATSPIVAILESIRDQTFMPEAEQKPEGAEASESAPENAPIVGAAGETPAQMIEAALRPYHQLVEGEPGRRPIDSLISQLSDVRANLIQLAKGGAPADELSDKTASAAAKLKADASTLPPPFAHMFIEIADDVTGEIGDLAVARIVAALRGAIGSACLDRIATKFPFARAAARDVALDDFAHVFGPKGLIDQFTAQHILPAADTSGPEWKWREGSPLAKRLGPSALADFQRAAEIRDAFFTAADPAAPGFAFSVTPPPIPAARLDIAGTIIAGRGRKTAAATARWPGPADDRRVTLTLQAGRRAAELERTGPWAIYRLIDAGHANGEGTEATFSLGGRDLQYRFDASPATPGAALNPLNLTQLRKFRCPHG